MWLRLEEGRKPLGLRYAVRLPTGVRGSHGNLRFRGQWGTVPFEEDDWQQDEKGTRKEEKLVSERCGGRFASQADAKGQRSGCSHREEKTQRQGQDVQGGRGRSASS